MVDSTIVMPKLGLTMSEGTLAEWLVAPGDDVSAGQILFLVETDKISNEIEAPAQGKIRSLLVEAGSTVPVGAALATWTGPGAAIVDAPDNPDDNANDETVSTPPGAAQSPSVSVEREAPAGRHLSTPLARRLARDASIDINLIVGTGPRERIQARDVRKAIEDARRQKPAAPAARTSQGSGGRTMRQLITARVSRSKAEIPHFYVSADANIDRLNVLRADFNAIPFIEGKLTVTAFLAMAIARALDSLPEADVLWRDDALQSPASRAISVAVDTPGGVMAPVVPITDGIKSFAQAFQDAVSRARAGRLNAQDMGEAVIGISNVGMFAVRSLTPIIDPDQTYMLGVGAPQSVFRPDENGEPVSTREISLSLACDHRAVDGALAARFLSAIVERIENPVCLLA